MNYEQANLTIVASKLTAVGLVAGAAGIMVQILTGIAEYPIIPGHRQSASGGPPGVTAVMAVGTGRRCGLILVGAFVTLGTGNHLTEPGEVGSFISASVQMLA